MKITSKGQITIPPEIRDQCGLRPGTDVEIVSDHGQVILRKSTTKTKKAAQWLRTAIGIARGRCTTRSIMTLTRGE
jgi:AbrB family looped-hinge helix DNA binding protein